jgi:hypothetical protein
MANYALMHVHNIILITNVLNNVKMNMQFQLHQIKNAVTVVHITKKIIKRFALQKIVITHTQFNC